jgi:hypothetical protein
VIEESGGVVTPPALDFAPQIRDKWSESLDRYSRGLGLYTN